MSHRSDGYCSFAHYDGIAFRDGPINCVGKWFVVHFYDYMGQEVSSRGSLKVGHCMAVVRIGFSQRQVSQRAVGFRGLGRGGFSER